MIISTTGGAVFMTFTLYRVLENRMVSHTHSDNSNGRPFESFNLAGVEFLSTLWCADKLMFLKLVQVPNSNHDALINSFFAPIVPSTR